PQRVMTRLAHALPLRVLPYRRDELEAVLRAVPYDRRSMMRAGAIRGLDAALPQIAVLNVLVTHRRVPDAIVQEAVKAIAMSCDEIGRANRLFAALRELFEPLRSQGPAALEFG